MRLVNKILVTLGIFAGVVSSVTLTSCGPQEEEHTHTFAEEWTSDDTHHWHEATCEHSDERDSYAEHTWDGGTVTTAATCTEAGKKTYTCTVCSATKTEAIAATGHSYAKEWSSDNTHHWHAATCGHDVKEDYAEHVFEKGVCTTCGCTQPVTDGLEYTLINNNTEYEVSGIGTATDAEVFIPSAHNGLPVTSIGEDAFYGYLWITSVFIPDSVTSIGEDAFLDCISLASIVIPNSVTRIGNDAFSGCRNLASITVAEGNSVYHSAANCLIETASKTLIAGCKTSVIPADGSVTIIGTRAFAFCYGLTSVIIPDSVTSIGSYAFSNCRNLTSVTIGSGVTSIGDGAFEHCINLASIVIPNNVTSIGGGTFVYCNSLTSIIIPDSVTSIGDRAFADCYGLTSIIIPESVTSIGDRAFASCYGLTSVIIPDSVTSIGFSAFYSCENLTSVTIGSGVESIGDNAFHNCYKLIEVYNKSALSITEGDTAHGEVALYAMNVYTQEGGSKLTDTSDGYRFYYDGSKGHLVGYYGTQTALTLPASFTAYNGKLVKEYEIAERAFYKCTALKSVTIPESVTSICDYAFAYCDGLTSIIIPDSVTSIGEDAFVDSNLTSVTIGNGVQSIGVEAFLWCNSLTSVIIPESVTSIGDMAFADCNTLEAVYYRGNATQWQAVTIGSDSFESATTVYCYSETQPTDTGNYWHYGTDGVTPVKW